jgi:FlaA1/EpsC-like NDP-sugar epimerase
MHCFILLFVDVALTAGSTILAIVLCSGETTLPFASAAPFLLFTLSAAIPVVLIFGLNRTVWRFTSLNDCLAVAAAVLAIVLFATAAAFFSIACRAFPEHYRSCRDY